MVALSPMMSRDRNTTTETTTVDIIPVMVDTATDTTTIKPIHFSFLNTESIFLVRKLLPSTEHFHQTALNNSDQYLHYSWFISQCKVKWWIQIEIGNKFHDTFPYFIRSKYWTLT